jgi:hypothetical protein
MLGWFNHGKKHRLNGPAIMWVDKEDQKNNQWWIDGIYITQEILDAMHEFGLSSDIWGDAQRTWLKLYWN